MNPAAGKVALGVVILAYGDAPDAEALARPLEASVSAEDVIVVHNPSGPAAASLTPPAGGVRVLSMGRNVGYATGMNAGLLVLMRGPYTHFLLLTQDAALAEGALTTLLRHARSTRIGVLAPVLATRETGRPWSYGGRTDNRGQVSHHREPGGRGPLVEVDWVDGACCLLARGMLDEIGLLDESFFLYFEETDLCRRARRSGWPVYVALDALGYQTPGRSSRHGAYEFLLTRNGMEYARRIGGARAVLTSINAARLRMAALSRHGLRSDGDLRTADGRARVAGIALGILAFLLRKWGPPPSWLPGLGDIAFTGRPLHNGP